MLPCEAKHDAVKVTLSVGLCREASLQFNIRKHQVAPAGIDCIASMLACLAPRVVGTQIQ